MPVSSKFLTESTGEKIGQYLAKIWTKYDGLVFLGHPVEYMTMTSHIEVRLSSFCDFHVVAGFHF